jgi:hypothetical protein
MIFCFNTVDAVSPSLVGQFQFNFGKIVTLEKLQTKISNYIFIVVLYLRVNTRSAQ